MRKISKKIMATALSVTMIAGMAFGVTGAVKNGTDVVATGKDWTSFSVHGNNAEDKGDWEAALKKDGQVWATDVTEESKIDSHKTYGECAKISSKKTASSYTLDVTSTGWSAQWTPMGTVAASNPWGVTATKVINVDRGRTYKVSFKIKSTLSNEIKTEKKRKDGTYYNVGTGKYNYKKHFHFKLYDNLDPNGAALKLKNLTATQGGKSVKETSKTLLTDFDNLILTDSQNTADDGWVSVSCKVLIPGSKAAYQAKKNQATVGIKFAFGAFLKEFKDENNMAGTIEVKDMKFIADVQGPVAPTKVKVKKAKKTSVKISYNKGKMAKKYEVQYGRSYDKEKMKISGGAKIVKAKKTTCVVKKLKPGKKYYFRVRSVNGSKKSAWSKVVSAKTKKK